MNNYRFLSLYSGLCSILVVGLAFSTYSFYSRSKLRSSQLELAQQKLNELSQQQREQAGEVVALKSILGFGEATDLATIREAVAKDIEGYAADLPGEVTDYHSLVQQTTAAIRRLHDRTSDAYERNDELRDKFTQMEASFQKQLDIVQARAEKLATDLAEEREAFSEDRERWERMAKSVADQLEEQRREKYRVMASYSEELRKANTELRRQRRLTEQVVERAKPSVDRPIEPDGFVSLTDPRSKTVWINVGSADNLQTHATFSVYEANGESVIARRPKGRIQVVRIAGEHLAEATVLESNVSDPLLPGDAIHSPAWDAGQKIEVAIAGPVDLDSDEAEDSDELKSLIERNGGKVVAELSAETRYLILGDRGDKSTSPSDDTIRLEQLIAEAKMLGVERIGVQEFLTRLGWKPPQIEPL